MNKFTVLFLFIQGFLVQNVFSQCTSRAAIEAPGIGYSWTPSLLGFPFGPAAGIFGLAAPYGYRAGYADIGYPFTSPLGPNYPYGYRNGYADIAYPFAGLAAPYGGAGEGNIAVAGELLVAGSTAIAGQVPIMGAVSFGGVLPAFGTVTITGHCGCGNSYLF